LRCVLFKAIKIPQTGRARQPNPLHLPGVGTQNPEQENIGWHQWYFSLVEEVCTAQHKCGFCKQRYTAAVCGRSRFTQHYDHFNSISVPDRQTHRDVSSRTVPQNNLEGHGASWCAYFKLNKLERLNTNWHFTQFLFCSSQFQLHCLCTNTCLQPGMPKSPWGRPGEFILYIGAYHLEHMFCSFYFTCMQKKVT
jgi:hypothetical protein